MPVKDAHIVPRMLSQHFADNIQHFEDRDGLLHVIDLKKQKCKEKTPRKTMIENRFYTIGGEDPDYVERAILGKLEDLAAPILKSICEGKEIDDIKMNTLLNLVAMQALRVPARRDSMDTFMIDCYKTMTALATDSDKAWHMHQSAHPELADITCEEAKAIASNIRVEANPDYYLSIQMPAFDDILKMLAMRSWSILECKAANFVLCDDPVVLIPEANYSPFYGCGFLTAGGIFMPLGRHHGLLGTFPNPGYATVWGTKIAIQPWEVARYNTFVVENATRYVVHCPGAQPKLLASDGIHSLEEHPMLTSMEQCSCPRNVRRCQVSKHDTLPRVLFAGFYWVWFLVSAYFVITTK